MFGDLTHRRVFFKIHGQQKWAKISVIFQKREGDHVYQGFLLLVQSFKLISLFQLFILVDLKQR